MTLKISRDMSLSKESWFYYLSNKLGFNLELCYNYYKENEIRFSKWISYSWLQQFEYDEYIHKIRCTKRQFIDKATHRSIGDIEILLDIDEPGECYSIMEKALNIILKLKDKKISYSIYFSGNKSYHISMLFFQLRNFSPTARTKLKRSIISQLGADIQKASARTMIAIEGEAHRKTGKLKYEVFL